MALKVNECILLVRFNLYRVKKVRGMTCAILHGIAKYKDHISHTSDNELNREVKCRDRCKGCKTNTICNPDRVWTSS